jgi:glycyl-tRNA synthetase (class II)
VTIRTRDDLSQVRVPVGQLKTAIADLLSRDEPRATIEALSETWRRV